MLGTIDTIISPLFQPLAYLRIIKYPSVVDVTDDQFRFRPSRRGYMYV